MYGYPVWMIAVAVSAVGWLIYVAISKVRGR